MGPDIPLSLFFLLMLLCVNSFQTYMTATSMQEQKAITSVQAAPNISSKKERKQYIGTALRILNLLANGCNQVEAAKACGVDESYVSQLQSEPDFQEQVTEQLAKNFKEASQIDDNYQKIEKQATEKLAKLIEHEYNPDRLLRVAKFANEAKRKLAPNVQNGSNGNGNGAGPGVAVLVLPAFMVKDAPRKEITLNPNNEIVAIDGKELTTFNSQGLDKLVAAKNERIKKAATSLPVKTNGSKQAVDPYSDL